jgi:hypothetical protein
LWVSIAAMSGTPRLGSELVAPWTLVN